MRRELVEAPARVLLIVDLKNVVYRSVATHGMLFNGRTFTGGLYGFIVSVLSAAHDVWASRIVVATDSPPYVRKAQFDGYKGDRKRAADDVLVMKAAQTMAQIRGLLALFNIPLWASDGFEYDDLCAWGVKQYARRFDRVVALTNDSDLYQLFDVPNFCVHRGAKGVYGRREFEREYGNITTEQWVTVLSMTGTHNAVPGIDGIGVKTALRALTDPARLRAIVNAHAKTMERNRPLITLPHADLPQDPGHRIAKQTISIHAFDAYCSQYAIRPTSRMLEALDELSRAAV